MDNSWSTSIEKLMLWRAGTWQKYDSLTTSWTLRVVTDLFLITANTKIFESINLHTKIKGIYKGDILILIVCSTGQEVRKIKFQIKHNVAECLNRLGQHFPLQNHNADTHEKVFESRYRNIEEVMRIATEAIGRTGTLPMPKDFDRFVRLCLMDPNMPEVITKTQTILEELKNVNQKNKDKKLTSIFFH